MPKFNVESNADLTEALKKLGITKVFTQEADFTPIVGEELGSQVFISGADHAVNFKLGILRSLDQGKVRALVEKKMKSWNLAR